MTFHHVGIPTSQERPGEVYLRDIRLHVTDVAASPYSIEWLRFEAGSPMPEELQKSPHLAFQVDDLQAAMTGKRILVEPFQPMPGVEVAFIMDDGAVIELMCRKL